MMLSIYPSPLATSIIVVSTATSNSFIDVINACHKKIIVGPTHFDSKPFKLDHRVNRTNKFWLQHKLLIGSPLKFIWLVFFLTSCNLQGKSKSPFVSSYLLHRTPFMPSHHNSTTLTRALCVT